MGKKAKAPARRALKPRRVSRVGKSRARPSRAKPSGARNEVEAALGALAHDIRTPLTGILALAELLASSELGERERRWADGIKNAADHLAQLTSVVCDAVRAGAVGLALRREPFSPRRLAEDLAASLSARAQTSGLRSEIAIADTLPTVAIGDVLRLRAAVENLIDNAVKFTARGSVKFEASAEHATRNKARLVFTVSDSGIGLTRTEIKKLFRPFAQANQAVARRYGGTGLGLTMVRRIARAMGGDLALTSKSGRGSRFRLTAIVERGEDTAALPHADNGRSPGAPAMRSRNLLCVEDNPYGRVVLSTILTELGHRTEFIGTGEGAIEAVQRARYDLVLMDVALASGIDGIEATRRLRAMPPPYGRIPVIGISGRTTPEEEENARRAGMDAYLAKPLSPSGLAEAIIRLTGR